MEKPKIFQENIASLEKLLEDDEKRRPKLSDFRGLEGFNPQEIEQDEKIEADLQRQYILNEANLDEKQKEASDVGRMAEHLVLRSIEEAGWLGKGVSVLLPTLYDDYVSHIDGIAERSLDSGKTEHLALSFDFTLSREDMRVKIDGILRDLERGKVPTIKYFSSPRIGKKYQYPAPKIVLGLQLPTITRLADAYTEAHASTLDMFKKDFENDPAQYIILSEILFQLKTYGDVIYSVTRDITKRDLFHKPFQTIMDSLKSRGVDMNTILRHAKGDSAHAQIVNIVHLYSQKRPPSRHRSNV